MVKLPTSEKTSSFGAKPRIKKGFYPAKLTKVELFTEKDGSPRVGKFGQQLIFSFAVYNKDQETDAPTKPMTYLANESDTVETAVIIPKFVYHMYKETDKSDRWNGEFHTAITPNSAITKILKALGWEFSAEGVDPDEFIGKWVELTIDDYTQGEGKDAVVASTIKDIGPYSGPSVSPNIEEAKVKELVKVVKQVKHEEVEKVEEPEKPKAELDEETKAEIERLTRRKEGLIQMNKEGLVTKGGLDQAIEQLDTKIKELENAGK